MPNNDVGELRRSAVVMTYAPGAVMDMRADGPVSGVSAGLEEWRDSAAVTSGTQRIYERRLGRKLGKKYFRLPPVVDDDGKSESGAKPIALVVRRFPEWLQCPKCDHLRPARKWGSDFGRAARFCAACTELEPGKQKVFVAPVRFATACVAGHLDEFPWEQWVQHRGDCKNRGNLKLRATAPGLAGLMLECPSCGSKRSMDGVFNKGALQNHRCQGRRPWLRSDDGGGCVHSSANGGYRVVQRGASNLYYPVLETALDIPPWTRNLERMLGEWWEPLLAIEDLDQREQWITMQPLLKDAVEREGLTARQVAERIEELQKHLDAMRPEEIRSDEYLIFAQGTPENDREFVTRPYSAMGLLQPFFGTLSQVSRLREVRVIKGFTRISPPYDTDVTDMSPLSVESLEWLPAIEVRGEGIFLQFSLSTLSKWESKQEVTSRCVDVGAAWRADWDKRHPGKPIPYVASPRLLMIHSFAHALIRQLTLECGYSTASLRERLYVSDGDDGMCGVLIYTGTTDADGTLGGLQSRGTQPRLEATVAGAIRGVEWCSSDPLCVHGEMAAPESHSIACCHACVMLPETSCELNNRFLDRGLLVGTAAAPALGYFAGLMHQESGL